ncbi:MAG: c-type cytochrome [Myxococcales bacterium]|nr:c-type cytochrome [Myxococcales bacterium]
MSKVTDEVRGHKFDGIEEYDNPLPRWWLGIFFVTIVIGIAYVPYAHMIEGNSLADEWAQDMEAAKALAAKQKIDWDNAALKTYCSAGDGWKTAAKANYDGKCAACHRNDGGGGVGPAFTDDSYLHGGTYKDIAETITVGVPAKGMIAWKAQLKKEEIQDLTCYVFAMKGQKTDKPAKAPQGTKVDAEGNAAK